MKPLIYIVEDDYAIRNLIQYALQKEEYDVKTFDDGKDIITHLKNDMPRLLILDIMLPTENGLTILKKIRAHTTVAHIPVIILTAKNLEYDKITGLDLGADDYITKPFSVMEFLARVRAVLRRNNTNTSAEDISFEDIKLNVSERTVRIENNDISLTYTEFEFLHYFLNNQNRVISREKLLSIVWGDDYTGETRTVDVHINNLRNKLGKYSMCLKTVRGIGYKFGN